MDYLFENECQRTFFDNRYKDEDIDKNTALVCKCPITGACVAMPTEFLKDFGGADSERLNEFMYSWIKNFCKEECVAVTEPVQ